MLVCSRDFYLANVNLRLSGLAASRLAYCQLDFFRELRKVLKALAVGFYGPLLSFMAFDFIHAPVVATAES